MMMPESEMQAELPGGDGPSENVRSLRSRLLSAAVWSAIGRILAVGAFYGSHFLLGRYLEKSHYAAYLMVSVVVATTTIAVTFGTAQILIRTIRKKVNAVQAIASCLKIVVFFGCIASLVLLIVSDHLGAGERWNGIREYVPWVAIWFIASAASLIASSALQAMDQFRLGVLVGAKNGGLLPNVLFFLLLVVSSQFEILDLGFVIILRSVLQLLTLIPAFIFTKNSISIHRTKNFDGQAREDIAAPTAKWFLSESWYTLVTQFVVLGMAELDVLIVGFFVADGDFANYGVAKTLINVVRIPLLMASVFLGPFIAELYYANQIDRLEKILRGAATIVGLPCLLIALAFVIFPNAILELTFGNGYPEAVPLLRILTFGTVVFVLTGCNGLTLIMTGHQRELMICSIGVLLIYLTLSPLILSYWGVWGGAWLNSILVASLNLFVTIMVRIKVNIWTTASPSCATLKLSLQSILKKPAASP